MDSACVAYDGSRILANPRSIVAMMRQANTVDITRRSPSYEIRLSKYATRGFEIYVPKLRREDVDPTVCSSLSNMRQVIDIPKIEDFRTFHQPYHGSRSSPRIGETCQA